MSVQHPFPATVPASAIGLPCGGAVLDEVTLRDKDALHWRVDGRILSLDPEADPICFRVLFPKKEDWNGRMLRIGGGGLDGSIPFLGKTGIGFELWAGMPAPVARGYVVYGCDSGHQTGRADAENWNGEGTADFSLNDEMLENYAYAAIKKLHDVVVHLVRAAYGRDPEHSYYAGSSNGGRQALIAAQRYGSDYDGVIVGYPAIQWIGMSLYGLYCANTEEAVGEEGFIDAATWKRVQDAIISSGDAADGIEDGIVSNFQGALRRAPELREVIKSILNPEQMKLADACASDINMRFLGYDEYKVYPGYALPLGEPLRDDGDIIVLNALSSAPGARDGALATLAESVIAYQVMRDANYDVRDFVAKEHVEELRAAGKMLDANSTDLSEFQANGGKLMLYHGTFDQLITMHSSIQYYEALCNRYGKERLRDFARFYVVPGEGHSIGLFDMGLDMLGTLDAWVSGEAVPGNLVARDTRVGRGGREMLLCEYPAYPHYVGGDPAKASSYEPRVDEEPLGWE